jgi:Rrf2 family transcriptional regulator, nitric oxide-sensitive transcriptional repressor
MRMTLHSDYALRLLIYLGLARGRLVTAEEVAKAFGLSKNHLMKVILGLVHHGHIETVRGRSGGVRLARAPEVIGLGAVIRDTEDNFALVECLGPNNNCVITGACKLEHILRDALAAYLAVLDQYTLADLVREPALARLLRIGTAGIAPASA